MNKLEIGMYVRTDKTGIKKIYKIDNNKTKYKYLYKLKNQDDDGCIDLGILSDNNIIKASHNIIDLIEEGDILLLFDKEYGKEYKAEVVVDSENFTVVVNYEQNDLLILEYELITNEHIELLKILTKEQFENNAYKVE